MWCINGGKKKFRMSHGIKYFFQFFFNFQVRKHQIVAVLSTLAAKGQKMHVRDARSHTRSHIQQQKLDHHAKII